MGALCLISVCGRKRVWREYASLAGENDEQWKKAINKRVDQKQQH